MGVAFIFAAAVCTLEGVLGIALSLWLLYALIRSKRSLMERVYRVPIYVSAVQNLLLCLIIAAMNFVHIFREGTFVTVMIAPLSQSIPREVSKLAFQIALVLTTMMWTLIPVTATLQLIGLSSISWPSWKRLSISFIFTILCIVDVAALSPCFVPSAEFNVVLEEIVRDLYEVGPSFRIVAVGSTAKFPELNGDRSMITLLLYLVLAPYTLSYTFFSSLVFLIRRRLTAHGVTLSERTLRLQRAFHIMQLMQARPKINIKHLSTICFQGFLPLAIISIPVLIFLIGAIAHANLDFVTLIFTFFLWLCPSVQAGVQIRFVRQAACRTPEPTRTAGISSRRRESDR